MVGTYPNLKVKLRWLNKLDKYFKWGRPWKEDDRKTLKLEYLSNPWSHLRLRWPKQTLKMLKMKMNSNGRWPQIIKNGIYPYPQVRSYPNLKVLIMRIKYFDVNSDFAFAAQPCNFKRSEEQMYYAEKAQIYIKTKKECPYVLT